MWAEAVVTDQVFSDVDRERTLADIDATLDVADWRSDEVAAHTVAMLLSLLRKPPTAHGATSAGQWGVP